MLGRESLLETFKGTNRGVGAYRRCASARRLLSLRKKKANLIVIQSMNAGICVQYPADR